MSKLPQDLTSFLFVVPWVARHPEGIPVAEVSARLGMSPAELRRLLQRVAMVGTPDGSPDELVDLYLEADRVFVALPQQFTRPPRFSVDEMLALLLVLAPLREAPVPRLAEEATALTERLTLLASERAISAAEDLRERMVVAADGAEDPAIVAVLETAVREHRVCETEYYTAGRDAFGARRLCPVAMLQRRGAWYVVGNDAKTFKVERFASAALTDERFSPSPDLDLDSYRQGRLFVGAPPAHDREVIVRIDGHDQRWRVGAPQRVRRWVLSQQGAATLERPQEVRDDVIAEAKELLARYA